MNNMRSGVGGWGGVRDEPSKSGGRAKSWSVCHVSCLDQNNVVIGSAHFRCGMSRTDSGKDFRSAHLFGMDEERE